VLALLNIKKETCSFGLGMLWGATVVLKSIGLVSQVVLAQGSRSFAGAAPVSKALSLTG
jgi:hypothetical protein